MASGQRIFLNIVATYGRSLYSLALGLFTARWALQALGRVDYGLLGLVGGLIGFVSFINGLMAGAVSRFYAVSVGAANKVGNEEVGLEDCRRWFNTAILIHTVLPIVLVVLGYPLGSWAVQHFLTIPAGRIPMCVWVWRFTCFSCFVGMFNVPFSAMYNAKQEIAELTIYSFVTTTLNACFLFYMVTHGRDWLVRYSCWTCVLSILPNLIIVTRAVKKYPECRFRASYLWDFNRFSEIVNFAFARFVSGLAGMVGTQVPSILVNKYLGPEYNAGMSVGHTVAGHAMTLSGSLTGAFSPAIANKVGEGSLDAVQRMSYRSSRLSALLILIFAIPLSLEVREILHVWLLTPPAFAAEVCLFVLFSAVIDQMTNGHAMAILSVGRDVMKYSIGVCWAGFSYAVMAWLFFVCGLGRWSICLGLVVYGFSISSARLYLGKVILRYSVGYWFRRVFLPIFGLSFFTSIIGYLPSIFLSASFGRIVLTTLLCEIAFLPTAWFFVLAENERELVTVRVQRFFGRK